MITVEKGKVIIKGSQSSLQAEMARLGEALRANVEEGDRNKLVFAFMGGLLVDNDEMKKAVRNLREDPDFDELIRNIKGEEE